MASKIGLAWLAALAITVMATVVVGANEGLATWYGPGFHGRPMYNGQIYDQNDPTTTAANKWPIGTWLRVTNPENGKSVEVQVRDRGAFKHEFDLSHAAFKTLANPAIMWLRVTYEVIPGPGQRATPPATPTPTPTPIPTPKATPPPTAAPTPVSTPRSSPTPAPAPSTPPTTHRVAAGESLVSIAQRYGLSARALAAFNGIANPDRIRLDQVLKLPGPGETPAEPPAPRATSTPVATPTPAPSTHRVAIGETLSAIAERYGINVAALIAANDISDPNVVVVDQLLKLPGKGDSVPAAAAPAPKPAPTAAPPAPVVPKTHRVVAGDTLWGVATTYGLSIETLASANQLAADAFVFVDQVLTIPAGATSTAPTPPAPAAPKTHRVVAGDTLWGIATTYGLSVEALAAANQLAADAFVVIDQELTLPVGAAAPGVASSPPAVTPAPAPQTHTVAEGESLRSIAEQYGVSIEAIIAASDIEDPDLLQVGQSLTIPTG